MIEKLWHEADSSDGATSRLSLTCDSRMLRLWAKATPYQTFAEVNTQTLTETSLDLSPHELVVIGRQQGGRLEYLDPSYTPSQLVPDSGQSVLMNDAKDTYVSRGHFTLKGSSKGILLLIGVPGVEGGVRLPVNWTFMVEPVYREMKKGEVFLVERGSSVKIMLPNEARILISAT